MTYSSGGRFGEREYGRRARCTGPAFSAISSSAMVPLIPEDPPAVGSYRLHGRLGSGGMGTVYLAHDPQGRPVAVKLIRRELALDHEFRSRFAGEVANAQRVAAFCTARVLDYGEINGQPYLVTEFVE